MACGLGTGLEAPHWVGVSLSLWLLSSWRVRTMTPTLEPPEDPHGELEKHRACFVRKEQRRVFLVSGKEDI